MSEKTIIFKHRGVASVTTDCLKGRGWGSGSSLQVVNIHINACVFQDKNALKIEKDSDATILQGVQGPAVSKCLYNFLWPRIFYLVAILLTLFHSSLKLKPAIGTLRKLISSLFRLPIPSLSFLFVLSPGIFLWIFRMAALRMGGELQSGVSHWFTAAITAWQRWRSCLVSE